MSKRITRTTCIGLDDFSRGIVRIDNTTCFVPNLLPGEEADIETIFRYGKLESARVIKRYITSKDRIDPPCPYYPKCGGCQIMHLSYPKQLEYKRQKVQDLLHKFAGLDLEVLPTIGLEHPTRFRNKVQKPIRYNPKKKEVEAGFYQTETHSLISIKDCLMESELSNRITNVLLSLFKKYRYPAYDEDKETGLIRHILIKTNRDQSQALVTLVVTNEMLKGRLEFAKELIHKVKEVQGVVLNINPRKTNVILGEQDIRIYGHARISDTIFDQTFLISTQSFYQTNSHQIEVLYGKAIEFAALRKTDSVLDAYCGTGTIGLSCAPHCKNVIGVEIVKDAVHDAITNAKINKITNARFLKGDCTEYMLSTKDHFDVIIMDPPRRGSTKEFISAVKKIKPRTVIYVSCDPITLARDLNLFKDTYDIVKVQPVDMFPNTLHVETVVLLEKKPQK